MNSIPLSLSVIFRSVRGIFICCCLLFSIGLKAQDQPRKWTRDSNYVTSFTDQPHITFELAKRNQRIDIRNPLLDTFLLRYEPNSKTNLIGSIDYRWLSLSLGLVTIQSGDSYRKGSSTQFSLRASFNGRRIWNTNFIQVIKGYYLTNPLMVDPYWNPLVDQYPLRPDLTTTSFFSNVFYCFNPEKFSYRAALWQLDRQEKSAGSFLAGLSMRVHRMEGDTGKSLIPNQVKYLFKPEDRIIAQAVTNFNFNVGYVHTFVVKHSWFLTLYLVPGISIQNSYYLSEDKQIRNQQNKVTGSSEFRFILGYNGNRWYSGLSSYSISFSGNRELGVWVDDNYNWFRFFVGYRLRKVDRSRHPEWRQRIGL
jgi:hypothetical protein